MRYEAVIIWDDGKQQVFQKRSEKAAQKCCDDFKMIFGEQIKWAYVKEVR